MLKKSLLLGLFLLIAFTVVIAGCGNQPETPEPPADIPAPITQPTPTMAAERVVLVQPADADQILAGQADTLLRELAAASGLEFEIRQNLINNEVTADMRVVIFLDLPDNLGSLAAGAPATQFVAITGKDWNPSANVSVIRLREENTAFMAGYMAALLAPNYRVGALLAAEKPGFNQAFINGVYYYCGNCAVTNISAQCLSSDGDPTRRQPARELAGVIRPDQHQQGQCTLCRR